MRRISTARSHSPLATIVIGILLLAAATTILPLGTARAESNPVWTRAVRISVLGNNSSWELKNYNAQQILAIMSDLRPTLLHRYISEYQVPTRLVPVCSTCAPMTVTQFLQATEAASNATIAARLSLWDYDNGTLYTHAASLLSIPITPPIRMLSIDDYGGWIKIHTSAQLTQVLNQLHTAGFTNIEAGGCGSHGGIANGVTNFGSSCFRYPSWSVSSTSVAAWKSYSSVKFVLGTQDFPKNIPYLTNMTASQIGSVYHNVAANQSLIGYHMIYFILQGPWDASKVTVSYGTYQGTLYGLMKSLMSQFNRL